MKRLLILFLATSLLCTTPICAQKPLTKPMKPTQTVPAKKSSTSTTSGGKSSVKSLTQSSKNSVTGYINGHEYVDLGLSVKWATCNVGASSPSDYGNYYVWGETKTKSSYTIANSLTYGRDMKSIAGNPIYDVARTIWGATWRLPTKEEIEELVNKCTHERTTQGEHKGYKVTGPNGNSIFLPAAGWYYETSLRNIGEDGSYCSATPDENDNEFTYSLSFKGKEFFGNYYFRIYGQSVRPVSE